MTQTKGGAAESINLLSSNGVHAVLDVLLPEFERTKGYAVVLSYGTGQELQERIGAGERADAVIASRSALTTLAREGILDASSVRDLARSSVGVAVRAGLPRPDVSSVEAFKRTLLAAEKIAFTNKGASGIHLQKLIEQLGIAREVRAKAVTQDGGLVGELVAQGRASLAIQQIPELKAVPGIDYVGPLPAALQTVTHIAAGVFSSSRRAVAARSLVEHLSSPHNAHVYLAKGMDVG
jgi:molybdate transport system substrate-binding protein